MNKGYEKLTMLINLIQNKETKLRSFRRDCGFRVCFKLRASIKNKACRTRDYSRSYDFL